MFEKELIDRVRTATDIAAVVGEHVVLRQAGAHAFKGLCPFHQEKTPSFHVNTAMQIFKCFGCGAAGSAFTFLMRIENVPFPEAVRRLADRAGIPLPRTDSPEEQERRRLLQACETAAALYARALAASPEAARARAYLASRKVARETVEQFRLGFSSGRELAAAKLHPAVLAKAGLTGAGAEGGAYDRMRGRLVIPITDESGRVIGFGGRGLDERALPKYLNSPESPLFKKSSALFALPFAKEAIRRAGRAVLVEGYFDAIAAHAHGVAETVAVLGTSLTDAQLRLLKRFAARLVFVYDEDMGGNEAALRGLDLATEAGFDVRIARLPGGGDPDEFLAAHGADGFRQALEDAAGGEAPDTALKARGVAVSLFDFRFEVANRKAGGAGVKVVAELLPFLARVPNAIERHAYVQRLADRLGVRERDVDEELDRFRARGAGAPPPSPVPRAPAPRGGAAWRAERLVLEGVLRHKASAVAGLLELPPEAFPSPDAARLAGRLRELLGEGEAFSVAVLMDDYQDAPAMQELLAAAGTEGEGGATEDSCREAVDQLRSRLTRARLRETQRALERAKDPGEVSRLLAEKQRLAMSGGAPAGPPAGVSGVRGPVGPAAGSA